VSTTLVRRRAAAASIAVTVALAGACGGSSSPSASPGTTASASPARSVVIAQLVDAVMVPGYQQVESSARALVTFLDALCAAPTPAALLAAQEAWRATNTAWNLTEAYRFGPAMDKASTVDYPIDPTKVTKLLAATKPPTPFTARSLLALGADVRGLEAIELVLFSPGAPADLDARRCSFAQAAAQVVARTATDVGAAWTDGAGGARPFAEQMKAPGPDSSIMTEQQAITEIVNGSVTALGAVTDKRLGRASGEVTGTPLPAETDAGAAHTAVADSSDILRSVQQVVGGTRDGAGTGTSGLQALIASQSGSTGSTLSAELAGAAEAIAAIPSPLASVPPSDVASVKAANLRVRAARLIFRTEVASQLGVTLTFSDSDGDS
jgi:predicted lipoprotein